MEKTLGYPHVEKLIDSEDFSQLNRDFETAYNGLEKIAADKSGMKTKKEAKKAMRAIEKVSELLKELLQIKYRLQEEIKGSEKK